MLATQYYCTRALSIREKISSSYTEGRTAYSHAQTMPWSIAYCSQSNNRQFTGVQRKFGANVCLFSWSIITLIELGPNSPLVYPYLLEPLL